MRVLRSALALLAMTTASTVIAVGTANATETCQQRHVCEVHGQGDLDYLVTFNDVGNPIYVDIMNTTCEPEYPDEELGAVICRAIPTTQSGHR